MKFKKDFQVLQKDFQKTSYNWLHQTKTLKPDSAIHIWLLYPSLEMGGTTQIKTSLPLHEMFLISACFVLVLFGCMLVLAQSAWHCVFTWNPYLEDRPPAMWTSANSNQQTGENKQREQMKNHVLCCFLVSLPLSIHDIRDASHHQNARFNLTGHTTSNVHKSLWRLSPLTEESRETFNLLCKLLEFVFGVYISKSSAEIIESWPVNWYGSIVSSSWRKNPFT